MRGAPQRPKPPIDPIRWQPPPSRPLPDPDLTATLHVVDAARHRPGRRRRRRRRQHLDRCRGRPHRADHSRRQLRAGGRQHRRPTAGPGGRPRRPAADLRQPPWSAAIRPRHRHTGNVGRRGGRTSADVLLQRRRIIRRHNLFHRVDQPLPLRVLQRRGGRGSPHRVAVPPRSRRHRQRAGRRSVLRQRRHADRRRVGVGVRRDHRLPAVQVLAHRRAGPARSPRWSSICPAIRTTSRPVATAGSGWRWSRTATGSANG